MKSAWLFPGQGTQRRGMGSEVLDLYPGLLRKADDILGYSIRILCLEDPHNKLSNTEFCQPAMYVVNALMFLERRRRESWPDYIVGHSLGEFSALYASGAFDFETGLKIVKIRAKLMATAGEGTMLAIIGPTHEELLEVILELGLDELDVANYNLPTQTVMSGPDEAIKKLDFAIIERKIGKTVHLHVGGAFHSRYAKSAAQAFTKELDRFEFHDPFVPILSSVTARPFKPGTVKKLLGTQILRSVQWVKTMAYLHSQDVSTAYQIGPGRVLDGLWARFEPD